jgi:hypothetical protein
MEARVAPRLVTRQHEQTFAHARNGVRLSCRPTWAPDRPFHDSQFSCEQSGRSTRHGNSQLFQATTRDEEATGMQGREKTGQVWERRRSRDDTKENWLV